MPMKKLTKKQKVSVIMAVSILCAAFVISAGGYLYSRRGRYPFRDLERSQMERIVFQFGAYEPYPLSEEEAENVITALRQIEIFEKTNDYMTVDGGIPAWFQIEMSGGEMVEIRELNPYFIINGTGYMTKDDQAVNTVGWIMHDLAEKVRSQQSLNIP